ncbi:MAG TPA: response regulator transcription factor [Ktedonobacterales bacterium]|jgi:DNA-binding response OmpR family regulator|nr:response regulator transcription factor [Ktedonobacterales bacterium]
MRVLVVEDERKLARLIAAGLAEERHTVDLAFDGDEAIGRAQAGIYDAIVLDVMLPGRSGIEVCRWLRAHDINTPVLLLTARDQLEDKVAGLDAGADDYMTKPFAFEELMARLRALARRASGLPEGPSTPTALMVGDLTLDLVRHDARRGERHIHFTTREFALLEFLMRHPGRPFSRTQIVMRVWPDESEATSNVVDTYIHYLRDKIDRGFSHPLLHTVRGVGYVIHE